ncbi:peptide-methionine (S)-S-oxide reductase MsrA [Williamsia sp.]|uniref:peptide-methionine (S)-S-oxide reductase MsrA n=1 Tax=Williamsia sp. TaxID=1872085 RepID=UPI001A1982AA|nr:peptide-methionine (S)-S-oxide reductase MsrA [Williamsia sp.]MBJ7288503.1 peptide-methionine (S)-S-oxide reductase MsrA [Williamsia sp.]
MTWFHQLLGHRKRELISEDKALAGRSEAVPVADRHVVNGHPISGPFDPRYSTVILAGGCFWGVEEIFWQVPGVYSTAVGYAGGFTPNPSYGEVCSARTGHTEAVLVVFDPAVIDLEGILAIFWETHDPTQGMRQGNDVGTQYRSAIYTFDDADAAVARTSAEKFAGVVRAAGIGEVTTEVKPLAQAGSGRFYYAEDYHQQYLAKNPHGYRCHSATGLRYPA